MEKELYAEELLKEDVSQIGSVQITEMKWKSELGPIP